MFKDLETNVVSKQPVLEHCTTLELQYMTFSHWYNATNFCAVTQHLLLKMNEDYFEKAKFSNVSNLSKI